MKTAYNSANIQIKNVQFYLRPASYYYYNHFMALWALSETTWVSQYQKVHFTNFWIFWCKMKITQAEIAMLNAKY